MNKKAVSMVLVAVIVIVVVVVVGVVAYWALTNNGGGEPEATPTPTPAASVEDATSLGFKVNATIDGANGLYAYTAKNLGGSNVLLRVDAVEADGSVFVYLYNQTAQTAWVQFGGEWSDQSATFSTYWDGTLGYTGFSNYKAQLAANWSGSGDYDYDSGGNSYHIYDIDVNPSIEDSLFVHG
jgi:hypothetical protein